METTALLYVECIGKICDVKLKTTISLFEACYKTKLTTLINKV